MYRFVNIFCPLGKSVPHSTHYESVRWFRRPRKPFWLGIAPSKKFVIKEPKKLPKIEEDELERLNYVYDRQTRSLMEYMKEKNIGELSDDRNSATIENSIMRSLEINDAWNKRSHMLRIERMKRELEEMEELQLKQAEEYTRKKEIRKIKMDQLIDQEIELSKTYVTEDNIDQFIDNCLGNVLDYNYAIDLKGNIYKGDDVIPISKLAPVKFNK